MSTERIQRGLRRLASNATVAPTFTGKVKEVNGYKCDVEPSDGGAVYYDVRLKVAVNDSEDGVYAIPEVGSQVMVLMIGRDGNNLAVIGTEKVKEYVVKVQGNAEVRLKANGMITINGDEYGGLVKVEELRTDLTKVNTFLNTLRQAIQSAPVVAQDGGASFKAAVSAAISTLQLPTYNSIESNKTKHGSL